MRHMFFFNRLREAHGNYYPEFNCVEGLFLEVITHTLVLYLNKLTTEYRKNGLDDRGISISNLEKAKENSISCFSSTQLRSPCDFAEKNRQADHTG